MQTRRNVLCGTGTAILAGLAGCSGLPVVGGGGESDGSPVDWIPATVADLENPIADVAHPADMVEVEAVANTWWGEPHMGVDPSDVETWVVAGSNDTRHRIEVRIGEFDPDSVRTVVEDRWEVSLEDGGQYGGFDRFEFPDRDLSVGLQDGVVVWATGDLFEATIDANAGDTERLIEESEEYELLVNSAGEFDAMGTRLGGREADAATATGQARTVGPDETEVTHVAVYPTASDASAAESSRREAAESDGLTAIDVSVDGRVVTVAGTRDTETLFGEEDS